MPGISNHAQNPKSKSKTDSTGLVATTVVVVLLLFGSVAAYLLMRWHFAKRREKVISIAAAADGVGREEGERRLRDPEILTATLEKGTRVQVRQRSVGGAAGDEDRSEGNTTERRIE
ncbi:hypothetical protein F5B21DRAFT_467217 [Xylaria acuta]|nr:hypothetical protein F5B21DRAFT_467217 [Xylaria acuta]